MQLAQVSLSRDAVIGVHTIDQTVQVFHCVLVAVRQNLSEKFLKEL